MKKLFIEKDYEEIIFRHFLKRLAGYYLSDVELIIDYIDELGFDEDNLEYYEKLKEFLNRIIGE